jgi:hypothetical protein
MVAFGVVIASLLLVCAVVQAIAAVRLAQLWWERHKIEKESEQ